MEGKKTTVHRLIQLTTTESGLVVSISYRPHFKQIASSLHTPSLTQRILLVRRRPVARIMALIPCRSIRQMLVNFSRPQENSDEKDIPN